jgi:hypothetical protein
MFVSSSCMRLCDGYLSYVGPYVGFSFNLWYPSCCLHQWYVCVGALLSPPFIVLRALTLLSPITKKGEIEREFMSLLFILVIGEYKVRDDWPFISSLSKVESSPLFDVGLRCEKGKEGRSDSRRSRKELDMVVLPFFLVLLSIGTPHY